MTIYCGREFNTEDIQAIRALIEYSPVTRKNKNCQVRPSKAEISKNCKYNLINLKRRRLLEAHGLTKAIFDAVNAHLAAKGLLLREGSVVDATIISAPQFDQEPQRHAGS